MKNLHANFESFFTANNYREEKYFPLQALVPADVAEKVRKKIKQGSKFLLTRASGVGNLRSSIEFMPGQHSPDKISVGLWISRAIHARLVKEAKSRKFGTISDFLEYLFVQATKNVELDENDYRKIADDTERARRGEKKRKRSD